MEVVKEFADKLVENIEHVIVGKRPIIRLVVATILCEGHILLEDVPGTGKTMLARAVAATLGIDFKRLQCTPDLLPNDVTGVSVFDPDKRQFSFIPGPAFTNILLADEINRATPRTQSALLESMGERQVTVDGITRTLKQPYVVFATQNPIEFEGTFPLPEAQLDRFFMKLSLGYLDPESEAEMIINLRQEHPINTIGKAVEGDEIPRLAQSVRQVHVDKTVLDYIISLIFATRDHRDLLLGGSPRGSIALYRASQAVAAMDGRDYVLPDDVKSLVKPILAHRCILHPESSLRGLSLDQILSDILENVPIIIGDIKEYE